MPFHRASALHTLLSVTLHLHIVHPQIRLARNPCFATLRITLPICIKNVHPILIDMVSNETELGNCLLVDRVESKSWMVSRCEASDAGAACADAGWAIPVA